MINGSQLQSIFLFFQRVSHMIQRSKIFPSFGSEIIHHPGVSFCHLLLDLSLSLL
eukprot:00631.XXX_174_338_1 [CDS] Oithona nana genome sequencing.